MGATAFTGVSSGDGTLASVTFEVVDVKESVIGLFDVILTDSEGVHLPHLIQDAKVEPSLLPSSLPSSAVISIPPASVLSPAIGEQLVFNVDIAGGRNVADFQVTLDYDPSALKFISESRGT